MLIFITFEIGRYSSNLFSFIFWIHLQIDHHTSGLSKFPTIKQLDPQNAPLSEFQLFLLAPGVVQDLHQHEAGIGR